MKRTFLPPHSITKQTREYVFFVTIEEPAPRSYVTASKSGLTLVVNR